MVAAVSQTDRVRAWILRGHHTTIADWDRQPAIDGGRKITRLARCIGDLKDEGLPVQSVMVDLGDAHVKEYWLASSSNLVSVPPQGSGQGIDATPAAQRPLLPQAPFSAPRCAIDDDLDWNEAA